MRRTLFIIASIVVSAVFLYLALRNVPISDILTRLKEANIFWIGVAFVLHALGQWTRAVRWSGLLDFKLPSMRAFHIINIGFLLNQLPLRAGEFARMVLATRSKVPLMTAATSVVLERMMDTLLVVILLVVTVSRLPSAPPEVTTTVKIFGIAVVVAFAVLVLFARFPALGHRVVGIVEGILPFLKRFNLTRLLDHVLDGLKPLTHWRSALHAIVWSLIAWAISTATVYALILSLGINNIILVPGNNGVDTLSLSILGLCLAALSIAIPVSVASIGIFESAVQIAGRAVGLSGTPALDATALSLGFLFHGVNIFGYAIWGVIGLLVTGISLGDVMNAQKPDSEIAEPTL
ncbi:MAG: lysylphosphatidylglycerol synthase transmembrane domain-containing protein [Chloroflexota bacterium]